MTAAPSARDRVLDAFEELLIDEGERAATLDAIAARAGVSKGGLLYHFASKDALVDGLIERWNALLADDIERMRTAPEGAVAYLIRTSIASDTTLDRAIVAAVRLTQGQFPRVREAMHAMRASWMAVLDDTIDDPAVAHLIMLVSDGLYYNSALRFTDEDAQPSTRELDELLAVLRRLTE